jgi:hypothetical protein
MTLLKINSLCGVFNRIFFRILLAVFILVSFSVLVLDRMVIAEVKNACVHPVVDPKLRHGIGEKFAFHWHDTFPVIELFEKAHPRLVGWCRRGLIPIFVQWCIYPHAWAQLDLTVQYTPMFGKNGERLEGLDAASRSWFGHGIEQASPDEVQVLHENIFNPKHPAWRK